MAVVKRLREVWTLHLMIGRWSFFFGMGLFEDGKNRKSKEEV